jgi:signal peptidase I
MARSRGGPWRVKVAEASMLPAIAPGDWLLVDPTVRGWPRRGSVVVFREPDTAELAIKRVAAGPGEEVRFREGLLRLAADEAWLTADADVETTAAAGFGAPRDSQRYGPVPLELLVGRAWFRYGPLRRVGRIPRR